MEDLRPRGGSEPSLQERLVPAGRCFGCGPSNVRGLRIRSFPRGTGAETELICDWTPEKHHEAFDGVLNGGIVGTLLDCHSNWTALWRLMEEDGLDEPPSTVTADFHVRLRRPTPSGVPLRLVARAVERDGDRVTVEARVESGGEVTATCRGHFVAVGPGHPAYQRW